MHVFEYVDARAWVGVCVCICVCVCVCVCVSLIIYLYFIFLYRYRYSVMKNNQIERSTWSWEAIDTSVLLQRRFYAFFFLDLNCWFFFLLIYILLNFFFAVESEGGYVIGKKYNSPFIFSWFTSKCNHHNFQKKLLSGKRFVRSVAYICLFFSKMIIIGRASFY